MRQAILALLLASSIALARARLRVGALTINGQTVRDVACELDGGGLGAVMKVVGALAKQKTTLDACAPGGAAYRIKWTWAEGKATAVAVVAASDSSGSGCMARAAGLVHSSHAGGCEATVLVGQSDAAARAADALAAPAK